MLSNRAGDNNAWFLKRFERALNRQRSSHSSRIDLATAENWLIRPDLLRLLRRNCWDYLETKHLSYAGGLGGAPELLASIAKFYNYFFSPSLPVEPQHLVVGPGCSAILDTLINDICDAGDGLLVAAPMWGSFEIYAVLRNGVKIIPVHVPLHDAETADTVVSAYREAAAKATCKVRGILFCNPHNPLGHISPVKLIDALLQYCQQADLHFISDEIYALSTFGTLEEEVDEHGEVLRSSSAEFYSVLQRDLVALGVESSRVHQIYSISKDFGSSGLRLGCLVTQSNKQLRMSQAILNNAKLCNVAAVMVAPILDDIENLATLVDTNKRRLRDAARTAIQFAEFHGLDYYKPIAGLYVWVRLSARCKTWSEEEDIVRRCSQNGVSIGSGADYAESNPGWFRVTFSVPQAELLAGLQRIEEAMDYPIRFRSTLEHKLRPNWRQWLKLPSMWTGPVRF
ncbi:PLP-dependent transferase [Westerdykella ornata]|uniref:PLP-dependent transferase n=1 Tax=Westerdykella ornata TaxID=318751 RepID=A0A6A6JVW0_WESOR|nr:PLP-dependent transferase [Westerdykella ornata]KAF2280365.1 PLP-dependent transferase [Westerdykella ornata]